MRLYLIRADKILEGKKPYFKFYDSDELETSEHVARISFTRVGYIEGREDGLPAGVKTSDGSLVHCT